MPTRLSAETKGASAKVSSRAIAIGRKTSRPKYRAATAATTVATVGSDMRGRAMAAETTPTSPGSDGCMPFRRLATT